MPTAITIIEARQLLRVQPGYRLLLKQRISDEQLRRRRVDARILGSHGANLESVVGIRATNLKKFREAA